MHFIAESILFGCEILGMLVQAEWSYSTWQKSADVIGHDWLIDYRVYQRAIYCIDLLLSLLFCSEEYRMMVSSGRLSTSFTLESTCPVVAAADEARPRRYCDTRKMIFFVVTVLAAVFILVYLNMEPAFVHPLMWSLPARRGLKYIRSWMLWSLIEVELKITSF